MQLSDSEKISLERKYPAKEHARKVISCLKDILPPGSAVTGILYVEGQKTRLLEVKHNLFIHLFIFIHASGYFMSLFF